MLAMAQADICCAAASASLRAKDKNTRREACAVSAHDDLLLEFGPSAEAGRLMVPFTCAPAAGTRPCHVRDCLRTQTDRLDRALVAAFLHFPRCRGSQGGNRLLGRSGAAASIKSSHSFLHTKEKLVSKPLTRFLERRKQY